MLLRKILVILAHDAKQTSVELSHSSRNIQNVRLQLLLFVVLVSKPFMELQHYYVYDSQLNEVYTSKLFSVGNHRWSLPSCSSCWIAPLGVKLSYNFCQIGFWCDKYRCHRTQKSTFFSSILNCLRWGMNRHLEMSVSSFRSWYARRISLTSVACSSWIQTLYKASFVFNL